MSRKIFQISISVILLLTFQGVFCQTPMYFSKAYCPGGVAASATNVLLTDSGYLIAGGYKDSLNHKLRLYIMHIDDTGNFNRTSTYGNDTIKYYAGFSGAIIQANDSDLFWATGKSNSIKDFASLIKIDRFYSKIWEVDYMYNNDTSYSYLWTGCVIRTMDNGFILSGEITSPINVSDVLLMKTDSSGNIQWRKQFVYKGVSMAWSVIQTPDHGFLLGGGGYMPYVKHSYQGLIIKTDSLGNEQWRQYPGSPDYDDSYCIVRNSPDGNYIVGTLLGVGQFYNSWYDFTKIRLIKFSNSGSVLWDKTYGDEKLSSETTQVYVDSNGVIVACGFYFPGFTDSVDTWSWILKTNNNGDSLWLREHYRYNGDLNTNRLYDIKPTPDGGYILVGQTDSFGFIPQSAWVLKVDSLGCAVPGCQYVGMKEVVVSKEELIIYPNPARDVIHLKIPEFAVANAKELRIFNASGQEVFRQELPPGDPQPTININHLLNGSYYLRVITPEISIAWSKVLIISK
jgi:hypothetical protein